MEVFIFLKKLKNSISFKIPILFFLGISGCGSEDTALESGLNPNVPPSENFDLKRWYLSIPTDQDGNDKADTIKEIQLNSGYENSKYYFTSIDGGMVFVCPIKGYKTSKNTNYVRVELREMLRAGNTDIATQGVNKNNWVFGSAPESDQIKSGGVDGTLHAELAINHVTTTGDSKQVGRVIIGQIHANNDEPLRLYYRKLPQNNMGSIYFAHEQNDGSENFYDLVGGRSDNLSNPSDGIALDENFQYKISVQSNNLSVTIIRPGKIDVTKTIDMAESNYDKGGQYMYFKAGIYNQNNTGSDTDYAQATFYKLEHSHELPGN